MSFDFGGDAMGGYDWGSDIGIDTGSYDYDIGGSALSNDELWSQLQGNDFNLDNWDGDFGAQGYDYGGVNDGGGEGPLSQTTGVEGGDQYLGKPDTAAAPEKQNSLLKALGMKGTADGTATDWADPKSLSVLLKGLGIGGSFLSSLMNKGKQANAQTGAQLQRQLQQNPYNAWNPNQAATANRLFSQNWNPQTQGRQYASEMRSPIVASRGYAEGGGVAGPQSDMDARLLQALLQKYLQEGPQSDMDSRGYAEGPQSDMDYAEGGDVQGPLSNERMVGLVPGAGMGQADDVPVNLSGGEYIFDADSVAALGDGNNAAGAAKLDALRESLREHKRAAPSDEIPPEAMDPHDYLEGN